MLKGPALVCSRRTIVRVSSGIDCRDGFRLVAIQYSTRCGRFKNEVELRPRIFAPGQVRGFLTGMLPPPLSLARKEGTRRLNVVALD